MLDTYTFKITWALFSIVGRTRPIQWRKEERLDRGAQTCFDPSWASWSSRENTDHKGLAKRNQNLDKANSDFKLKGCNCNVYNILYLTEYFYLEMSLGPSYTPLINVFKVGWTEYWSRSSKERYFLPIAITFTTCIIRRRNESHLKS